MGRLWVPLDVDFQDDPTIIDLTMEAELAYLRSMAACGRHPDTSELFELGEVSGKVDDPLGVADELVAAGVWERRPAGLALVDWDAVVYRDRDSATLERSLVTQGTRTLVLERDGHRCRVCGATSPLEVDHWWPIARGAVRSSTTCGRSAGHTTGRRARRTPTCGWLR